MRVKGTNIKALKNQAANAWKNGKKKEAHELWEKARLERLSLKNKP